jgi:hypothetical protein
MHIKNQCENSPPGDDEKPILMIYIMKDEINKGFSNSIL